MQPQTKQPLFYDYEGLPPDPISVLWGDAKSSLQGTKIITLGAFTLSQIEEAITNVVDHAIRIKGMVTTHTRPCLYDCGSLSHHYIYLPDIKVVNDDTWDDFGRDYFESCDYPFTEFHCTLCSVDEIRQKIEAWMLQYEQNRIVSMPYAPRRRCFPKLFEHYLAENLLDEKLSALIEDLKAKNTITEIYWDADGHSCHPFKDKIFYLHQLAKQILSGYCPHVSAAKRPRCRSLLMATCHQLSGDDLLGH